MRTTTKRTAALLVVVFTATAGCVSKGSDAIDQVRSKGSEAAQQVAALGVRKIAVGTWHCTEAYDDEITQDLLIGIAADGRWGTGRTDKALQEAGTWKLDGLELEVEFPLSHQGVDLGRSGLTYTGDADPPTEIDVVDHVNSDSKGHFEVTVSPDRFTAQQPLTYQGGDHIKRYECDKQSSEAPKLRPLP